MNLKAARADVLAQLEAQRFQAQQAPREQPTVSLESFWPTIEVLMADNRWEEARRRVAEWRASVREAR